MPEPLQIPVDGVYTISDLKYAAGAVSKRAMGANAIDYDKISDSAAGEIAAKVATITTDTALIKIMAAGNPQYLSVLPDQGLTKILSMR